MQLLLKWLNNRRSLQLYLLLIVVLAGWGVLLFAFFSPRRNFFRRGLTHCFFMNALNSLLLLVLEILLLLVLEILLFQ